jgi:hypothetical protein
MRYFLAVLLFCSSASAETFLWDAPATWDNGTPLVAGDIKEYRLYDGAKVIATVPGDQTSVAVAALSRGVHTLTVTAVSADELESDKSNELRVSVAWKTLSPLKLRYTK